MKFEGQNMPPGEFASKCLFRIHDGLGWDLSQAHYFSYEEARASVGPGFDIKWPVEIYDNSLVYVPALEELK